MTRDASLVVSYLTLRRVIGILGCLLPIVLVGGGLLAWAGIKPTLSDYYFSNMQDFFVGLMCAVGIFLITYKGYDSADNITTNLCGAFAIGIALFPTLKIPGSTIPVGIFMLPNNITVVVHFISAIGFLLGLAAIPFFLFTRGNDPLTIEKKRRNLVYRICGILIAAMVVAMIAAKVLISRPVLDSSCIILIFESIALWAFGFSWWVKGETLWKDKRPPRPVGHPSGGGE
jgi:hypothetical protein